MLVDGAPVLQPIPSMPAPVLVLAVATPAPPLVLVTYAKFS